MHSGSYRARWILAALFVGLAFAARGQEPGIRVVETRPLATEQPAGAATHALRLVLYTFRGGRWQPDAILPAAREAASLLVPCGVAVTGAELRVLEAPPRYRYYATALSRDLVRRLDVPKPAIFFVDETLNRPAFDAEAIGLGNSATRPELANTVWVAHGGRDLPQALAHELVHVLANSGEHSEEPGNLMGEETSAQATRLSPAQCADLRRQGEANGLLKRLRAG